MVSWILSPPHTHTHTRAHAPRPWQALSGCTDAQVDTFNYFLHLMGVPPEVVTPRTPPASREDEEGVEEESRGEGGGRRRRRTGEEIGNKRQAHSKEEGGEG
eukprot:9489769-Pyramimonas_sp.AAC.1